MPRIFIAAGSNLGDRRHHLETAFQNLCREPALKSAGCSPVYETKPAGGPPQGNFLNTVWLFETVWPPEKILAVLQEIERKLGRVRGEKNGPREIDLDLIAYDELCVERPGLHVPHERMHTRWFVLKPLCDLAPQWKHPELNKTAAELLAALEKDQTA